MSRPLPSLLPPLLRPVPPASPDDEAAFAAWAATLTGHLAVLGALLMAACTLAWWPLDPLVMPDARHREAFAALRERALAVELGTLALFLLARPRGRAALVLAPACYALLLGSMGWSLGALGPDGVTWLANAVMGIVPATLLPIRLAPRALATAALGAALLLGFFLPHPGNAQVPGALGQVSFTAFAAVLTVALGELTFRILRRAFLERRATDRANARLADLTDTLADRVAERTRDLRALALHLDRVQETERRRLARDLHDDLGQSLTAMRYTLARLEDRAARDPADLHDLLDDLGALLEGTTATVRGVVATLRPRVLEELGLVAAAEWLRDHVVRASGLACTLAVSPAFHAAAARLDPEASLVLFRALQEAATNALKHAGADALALALDVDADAAVATVTDTGGGFDPAAPTDGFGLLGLRERLRAAGGDLDVRSEPGRGARVRATLPLAPAPSPAPPLAVPVPA